MYEKDILYKELESLVTYQINPKLERDSSNDSKKYGFLKEKSYLRKDDLKTIQEFEGNKLFYAKTQLVDVLDEKDGWLLVDGWVNYIKDGLVIYYSDGPRGAVNVKGWIKKTWLSIPSPATTFHREMKFELQTTSNIIWRTDGKAKKLLPRKFGPREFLHKGIKGSPAKGSKEGTAIELQSEERGFVEFETANWIRNWCKLKERIQEAVDMINLINKETPIRTISGINTVKFPFDINHLKKRTLPKGTKTKWLGNKEWLEVEIKDPEWEAKIQASESIELSQYESLLKEHVQTNLVTSTISVAQNVLDKANTAKIPSTSLINLLSFLQILVYYIIRGQTVDLKGRPAKVGFRLMSRTNFSSIYHSLLNATEKAVFKQIVSKNLFLDEVGRELHHTLTRKSRFFKNGHGAKHHQVGPTIFNWLVSIYNRKRDLLSPPDGGSASMGRFDVIIKIDSKDRSLVRFEIRGSVTHGNADGELIAPAKDIKDAQGNVIKLGWVSLIEKIFKQASISRDKDKNTGLIYDPSKCP